MKRTVIIILTVALLAAFATPAHADGENWPLVRGVGCILSERVPTERMALAINQYIATGNASILQANGWGVGYDGIGQYYHYFGLKCYAVKGGGK